jgi:hypothetical protein
MRKCLWTLKHVKSMVKTTSVHPFLLSRKSPVLTTCAGSEQEAEFEGGLLFCKELVHRLTCLALVADFIDDGNVEAGVERSEERRRLPSLNLPPLKRRRYEMTVDDLARRHGALSPAGPSRDSVEGPSARGRSPASNSESRERSSAPMSRAGTAPREQSLAPQAPETDLGSEGAPLDEQVLAAGPIPHDSALLDDRLFTNSMHNTWRVDVWAFPYKVRSRSCGT